MKRGGELNRLMLLSKTLKPPEETKKFLKKSFFDGQEYVNGEKTLVPSLRCSLVCCPHSPSLTEKNLGPF
jgi:hypothetical protein